MSGEESRGESTGNLRLLLPIEVRVVLEPSEEEGLVVVEAVVVLVLEVVLVLGEEEE
jgi:hypothetical protein